MGSIDRGREGGQPRCIVPTRPSVHPTARRRHDGAAGQSEQEYIHIYTMLPALLACLLACFCPGLSSLPLWPLDGPPWEGASSTHACIRTHRLTPPPQYTALPPPLPSTETTGGPRQPPPLPSPPPASKPRARRPLACCCCWSSSRALLRLHPHHDRQTVGEPVTTHHQCLVPSPPPSEWVCLPLCAAPAARRPSCCRSWPCTS